MTAWLGPTICVLAAFRLRATPLDTVAAATALLTVTASVAGVVLARARAEGPPRWITAAGHVTAATGAFFLFVSFAL